MTTYRCFDCGFSTEVKLPMIKDLAISPNEKNEVLISTPSRKWLEAKKGLTILNEEQMKNLYAISVGYCGWHDGN